MATTETNIIRARLRMTHRTHKNLGYLFCDRPTVQYCRTTGTVDVLVSTGCTSTLFVVQQWTNNNNQKKILTVSVQLMVSFSYTRDQSTFIDYNSSSNIWYIIHLFVLKDYNY